MKHSIANPKPKIFSSPNAVQKYLGNFVRGGKTIGFVPTMGALHKGHISLISRSRRENDITIVSIFVNPIQFGPSEDFKRYPRPFENDVEVCRQENVDVIFAPRVEDMYPEGFDTVISVGKKSNLSDILCGAKRKGHFDGVATVVAKLFNIIRPTRAYFGQKDYQQLKIIERMSRDLNFSTKIIPCPTAREPSGLAMSSRNVYLNLEEKSQASSIYKIISSAKKDPFNFVNKTSRKSISVKLLVNRIVRLIKKSVPSSNVEYVSILRSRDLSPLAKISKNTPPDDWRIFVAVRMKKSGTRLIDNI